jgi:hypothetical protein
MSKGITRDITLVMLAILPLICFRPSGSDGIVKAADPDQPKPIVPSSPCKVAIYDADPDHLWNRLYAALYVRTADDGQAYGLDDLDPLLWENSRYLLTEPRYQQVLDLLNEFLNKRGEKLIAVPLKRALFQHDLWAVFDWLADPDAEDVWKNRQGGAERRALRNRLASIIHRLALSAEDIEKLPDNLSVALAGKAYPPKQDPSHTAKAFLPGDLFEVNGPWVHFQNGGGKPYPFGKPTALTHVHFVGGRSAFFVFVNLPEERRATLEYLQKLNTLPHPVGPSPNRTAALTSNPNLPPSGTKLALVRQMLLIDDSGKMRPTRLIESVQIRVVRGVAEEDNDFFEFSLHRKELFDGNSGLRAGKSDQVTIPIFNRTHDEDLFSIPGRVGALRETVAKRIRKEPVTENLRLDCVVCHKRPEIASASAFFHDRSPELTASERANEVERIIRWKGEKYNWGLLQGLIEERK